MPHYELLRPVPSHVLLSELRQKYFQDENRAEIEVDLSRMEESEEGTESEVGLGFGVEVRLDGPHSNSRKNAQSHCHGLN